jgi:tRNA (adenine22-N1)-methyltransferase
MQLNAPHMSSKLSKRLLAISSQINGSYEHIWDTCCDHGLLGFHLLTSQPKATIHFLDQVALITQPIEANLTQLSNVPKERWYVHTMDCKSIDLSPFSGTHLIIIAGVGGELAAKIIQAIVRNHPNQILEFILCPVHHTYSLRNILVDLDMKLIHEKILEENERYYELLHITTSNSAKQGIRPLTNVGAMWQENNPTHQNYLKKLILHYQKKSYGGCQTSKMAIKDYTHINMI